MGFLKILVYVQIRLATRFIMQEPFIQNHNIPNNQRPPFAAAPPEQPIGYSSDNFSNNVAAEKGMNWARIKKSKIQWGPLIATILFVLGVINMIILHLTVSYWKISLTLLVFFLGYYPVYLIIACCCDGQAQRIDNIESTGNIQEEYNYYRQLGSHFKFTALCYHYETRYITHTEYDSKGNKRTWTQSRRQMMVTHRAEQPFSPTITTDVSGDLGQILSNTALLFIKYRSAYRFDGEQSRQRFTAIFERFKGDHRQDKQQSYYIDFMVPGIGDEGIYFVGPQRPNLKKWYCFFVMIGMSWPYSLWMESKITRFEVVITKMITV